jgi:hypothetical protein
MYMQYIKMDDLIGNMLTLFWNKRKHCYIAILDNNVFFYSKIMSTFCLSDRPFLYIAYTYIAILDNNVFFYSKIMSTFCLSDQSKPFII